MKYSDLSIPVKRLYHGSHYPRRFWFHLVPKGADVTKGLLSPWYMNKINSPLLSDAIEKYRNRVAKDWGIMDVDPETLTADDILNGLNQFRGEYGTRQIYMFPFAPKTSLGPNMRKTLAGKDVYEIDLEKAPGIIQMDYGFDMSNTDNRKLTADYYRRLTYEKWTRRYDDNNPMLFSTLNHISIATKSGFIPPDALRRIDK